MTNDKRTRVVFNAKTGFGTVTAETLYHQRLRPALEYVELWELVSLAGRLESTYGYPVDIEFGIEGSRLWVLQVRPVGAFLSALRETLEQYPLKAGVDRNSPQLIEGLSQ
jgi:phosphoenolpyruvate synthase/pyruvate phosphate dikinase